MEHYRVVSYRNINSDGSTKTNQTMIRANTIRGAKMQASSLYPTKGRWLKLDKDADGYVKGAHGNLIGGDRLFIIPIS